MNETRGSGPPDRRQYEELRDASLLSDSSAEDDRELERLILADDELLENFTDHLVIESQLWTQWQTTSESGFVSVDKPQSFVSREAWGWMAACSAIAMTLLVYGVASWRPADPIGRIIAGQRCSWGPSTLPTEDGSVLSAGTLNLQSGLAELKVGKVTLTLQGPVRLRLQSRTKCYVDAGRVFATVDAGGEGFVIETPTSVLTDRGTEFGVNVDAMGDSQLTVIKGRVDARHRSSGRTMSVRSDSTITITRLDMQSFEPSLMAPELSVDSATELPNNEGEIVISTAIGDGRDTYVTPSPHPSEKQISIGFVVKNNGDLLSHVMWNRRGYLHFDLSSLLSPPREATALHAAQLILHGIPTHMGWLALSDDTTFSIYGITDETQEDWTEESIDWLNAPGVTGDQGQLDPTATTLLGQFTVAPDRAFESFVVQGSRLRDFLASDTNGGATFMVISDTVSTANNSHVHGFATEEHPYLPPPTLRLSMKMSKE